MQDDKRRFIRFDIPLDVQFKVKEFTEYSTGVTINFSRTGLCFVSSDPALNVRDILELRVKLPNNDSFTPAVGDVVWKKQSGTEYFFGVKLIAMDKEAKSSILDTAYNLWLGKMRSENLSDINNIPP